MLVSIENLSDTLVLLRLNSGATRHLAPGEIAEVEPVEVKGNAAFDRLAERRLVAVLSDDEEGGGALAHEGGDEAEAEPRRRGRRR